MIQVLGYVTNTPDKDSPSVYVVVPTGFSGGNTGITVNIDEYPIINQGGKAIRREKLDEYPREFLEEGDVVEIEKCYSDGDEVEIKKCYSGEDEWKIKKIYKRLPTYSLPSNIDRQAPY